MSATPESVYATPLEKPHDSATEVQALRFLILQRLLKVQTITVVEVQAVHGGGLGPVGTVDVLPLVNQVDGAGNPIPHQTIYGRPYVRWQGGVNAVILDPQEGDLGVCCFASRDISSVISSKQQSVPASGRIFSFADGLYMGGTLNDTPENYFMFDAEGNISVVTTGTLSLQAAQINITGPVNANGAQISGAGEIQDALGVVVGTHTHSGVQSGSDDSGPPVT